MSQTNSPLKPAGESPQSLPAPRLMFKLTNPLIKLVLRSPLHGGMSKRLMVLSFTGRKSGRRYSTPVGYLQYGNTILVFTHSAWRTNFKQPALVSMRIRGKEVSGKASLVTDAAKIKQIVSLLVTANGEGMARRMGLWVDRLDASSPEEVLKATRGTYFIEITLSQELEPQK